VRIGGYLLDVINDDDMDDSEASTIVRGRAAVDALTPGVERRAAVTAGMGAASNGGPRSLPGGGALPGMGDLGAPLSRGNPFADLLGDGPPPAAGVPASSAAWAPVPAPARQLLPDDFDPFAEPTPAPAVQVPAPQAAGNGPFADLIPNAEPASIDQLFGLQGGERDPLAGFMADIASPVSAGPDASSGHAALSTDPMALFGDAPEVREPSGHAPLAADNVSDLHAAFVPPAVRRPRPDAAGEHPPMPTPAHEATPSITAPTQAWHGDPQALWAAFCEGAGVAVNPPQGVNPDLMRVAGALLQAAVEGALQLMSVRATTKHELHAQVTMIQARDNNPLKFSPDARSALEQMLQPPMRGFMAGPAAMKDAMHDLVGHAIGTMAGTRAALEGVLDRFTPQQLETKLIGKSMLDSLLPMNRKAKLWDLYLQHFDAIRNEAQDDFHSLFGRAFLAAYEQQLDRLE